MPLMGRTRNEEVKKDGSNIQIVVINNYWNYQHCISMDTLLKPDSRNYPNWGRSIDSMEIEII